MEFHLKPFRELSAQEVYDLLALRCRVFVVEQHCPYQDIDGEKDFSALHMLGKKEGQLAAYARIIAPQAHDGKHVAIGRVIIAPEYRGNGFAKQLFQKTLDAACQHWQNNIYLQAQDYLIAFYRSFGFVTTSDSYLEDNIPHTDMLLRR